MYRSSQMRPPREIWIEINIHTSFKTETSEAIIDCLLVVIIVQV